MGADARSFLWRPGVAFALALAAVCGAGTARAQVPGHLNVPGSQMIHAGFTPMPANETRLVLRVPLIAGRAFAGVRHPVVVHYGPPGIEINPRLSGYVLPH